MRMTAPLCQDGDGRRVLVVRTRALLHSAGGRPWAPALEAETGRGGEPLTRMLTPAVPG